MMPSDAELSYAKEAAETVEQLAEHIPNGHLAHCVSLELLRAADEIKRISERSQRWQSWPEQSTNEGAP